MLHCGCCSPILPLHKQVNDSLEILGMRGIVRGNHQGDSCASYTIRMNRRCDTSTIEEDLMQYTPREIEDARVMRTEVKSEEPRVDFRFSGNNSNSGSK